MKRYYRTVSLRLAELNKDQDELRNELAGIGLRVERISSDARDLLVDVSLAADTEEQADAHARVTGRFVRAWRVTVTRVAPPRELGSDLEDRRREVSAASFREQELLIEQHADFSVVEKLDHAADVAREHDRPT